MAGNETVRVPCARCQRVVTTDKMTYQNAGKEIYCDDCLVPFTCTDCGKRYKTTPETVSANRALRCESCSNIRKRKRQKEPNRDGRIYRLMLTGIARIWAALFAFVVVSVVVAFFYETTNTPMDGIELIAYGVVSLIFILGGAELARLCWIWHPSMGFRGLVLTLIVRMVGIGLVFGLVYWVSYWIVELAYATQQGDTILLLGVGFVALIGVAILGGLANESFRWTWMRTQG